MDKEIQEEIKKEYDEKLEMCATMKRFGGSFVQSLAECFIRADQENLKKLYVAFPNEVALYSNWHCQNDKFHDAPAKIRHDRIVDKRFG